MFTGVYMVYLPNLTSKLQKSCANILYIVQVFLQIIVTSAEVTPDLGGFVRGSPPNPLSSGLGSIGSFDHGVWAMIFSNDKRKHATQLACDFSWARDECARDESSPIPQKSSFPGVIPFQSEKHRSDP